MQLHRRSPAPSLPRGNGDRTASAFFPSAPSSAPPGSGAPGAAVLVLEAVGEHVVGDPEGADEPVHDLVDPLAQDAEEGPAAP